MSPSSTVRVTSFNCGMLQIWTWFQWVWYTGLLDSCGYSKKLSSPIWLVSVGAKPWWYSITTFLFRSYNYSMRLVVASSRGSVGIDQVRSREFWASWSQVDLTLSVSHLSWSLWPIGCHCAEFSLFPLSVAGAMARGCSLILVWMTISHTLHIALSLCKLEVERKI